MGCSRPEGSIRGDRDGGERIQTEVGASE